MSGPLLRSGECRKFAPNIFNKTKCTNCFRQKEEHSAEALESNRATRKVAKCGYLFVAPGWDFTNPLNRTKRWQRRWFVLYDDGELSYALDEHPETVPQASIDMNKVMEVAEAEDITGNAYSLAITAPDNVHFVKGTCREEARWWNEVLSVFPRSKGRPKRNATFPGPSQTSNSAPILQTPPVRDVSSSVSSDLGPRYAGRLPGVSWEGEDVFPTRDLTSSSQSSPIEAPPQPPSLNSRKVYMGSPPTRDKVPRPEEKVRTRRVQNREKRGLKSGRSYSEDLTKMLPASFLCEKKPTSPAEHPEVSRRLLLEEFESECKLKDIADSLTRPRHRRLTSPAVTPPPPSSHEPTRDSDNSTHKQVRGDPDGCGLDLSSLRYSPSSELRVELPAEDLLNIKKGWLMKQGNDKEWNKHWFVLRGAALLYYRDPTAEDQGILDGVIDLSGVSSVMEVQVARNYGFVTTTWDDRSYILSAVTSGIRANWMSAIRRAAGLETKMDSNSIQIERDRESIAPTTPLTGRSIIFSSDDEYRTASEGRRESGEWGETLPPSPPLNRTPISKVKERARGGMRARAYNSKRSRSSPPSSRRSTLDSVPQEDLILTCCGELQESDVDDSVLSVGADANSLLEKVKTQSNELQEVKRQLTSVLCELSNAEEELLRLRQRKVDVSSLEKQVEELLQRAEDANKQRARDSAELDSLKKRYVEEKARWERRINNAQCELEQVNQRYSQICTELADSAKLVQRLREELAASDDLTRRLRDELESVTNRLAAGIEENDQLYRRLRELETRGHSLPAQPRSRSVDSLSDLTNIQLDLDLLELDKERVIEEYSDLRSRFEKAVVEIRMMKRELKESQAQADCLELSLINARQDSKAKQEAADSQNQLMAARIQDLALKLCNAEKQIRALKQKLSKSETREKRRSLSLKGRESFTIGKELEDKLAELEKKISALTSDKSIEVTTSPPKSPSPTKSFPPPSPSTENSKMAARLRRKSLDSATCSEPMKVLIRLSSLEAKVAKAAREIVICPSSPSPSPQPSTESSISVDEPDHRSKSESPLELKLFNGNDECDEVDGNSQVQHHIFSEVKKMENLLRRKLTQIAKKRDSLQASGQWTNEARLSLLAEKLAFESVFVGRLHDAASGSVRGNISDVERFMVELDQKLSGSKPNIDTSLDYLAKALTRHLLNQNLHSIKPRKIKDKKKIECPAMTELKEKKKGLDQKVSVFVDQVVDKLAVAFAVETLGDDSSNSGEKKIKAAWTLAQEAVNEELIQAEISQVMSQCSSTYQNMLDEEKEGRFVTLIQERASLELWSKTTEEHLQKEMDKAVKKLHEKYQDNVYRLKTQNSSPPLTNQEDEQKSRLLLQNFVDVIAHKALLDARISLIQELDWDRSDCNLQEMIFDDNVIFAEVQSLYLKYYEGLQSSQGISSLDESKLKENMELLVKETTILREYLSERSGLSQESQNSSVGLLSNEDPCIQCNLLKDEVKQLQQLALNCKDCKKCGLLQEELKRREIQFEEDINDLKTRQEEELSRFKAELDQEKINLVCQHEGEQALLKERARKLERRLGTLDSEYSQQMENLRAAYHKTLSSTLDRDLPGGENIRQRYQVEIEHLRALCEKGLIGMENSHRRMIAELEEKHRQEAEQLRREKELALAEETQATLAALDAMRKAHQAEVTREVNKFKQEFLKSMQSSQDIGALHREHEAEMEEIKKEILSLSEKYSVKCVESASLEEQLRAANEQLAQAQQHILQLDSRNKQLRAHLVSEANDCSPTEFIRLEEKEKPLTMCCGGGRPETIAAAIALLHKRHIPPGGKSSTEPSVDQAPNQDPSSLPQAEMKWHPLPSTSCAQDFLSPSLCSLSGMVAERKKLFEH